MKRRNPTADCDFSLEAPAIRKRFARVAPSGELLPCNFKLLRHWELTEEASRFLSKVNRVEEGALRDRSCQQMAMVVY